MAFYSTTGIMASFLPTFFEERMGLPIRTVRRWGLRSFEESSNIQNGLYTMTPFIAQIFFKNGLAFGQVYFMIMMSHLYSCIQLHSLLLQSGFPQETRENRAHCCCQACPNTW